MSAVPKPQEVRLPLQSPQRRPRLTVVPSASTAAPAPFPKQTRANRPLWLKLLVGGQWLSLGVAALTVVGALSAYGLTVNTNRRLATATTTLESLQEQQQQLTTANAVFKNHLAQIAVTYSESSVLHPKEVIFLEMAEPASLPEPSPTAATAAEHTKDQRFLPKGY
ncbi:hypothetical protein PN498_19290 [Oscillatoria sp. CS-180]|uniref:hypothetical protein n=1 Tax=Oscillatoria sp. CS-180 TaxID=3021720 RepID=UPI00232B5F35|nr:hypothetical protein [Oscillatoria sp. CS-180]MDB9528146.1 hypothetical protein [Oscillatoria sp. CS-180]